MWNFIINQTLRCPQALAKRRYFSSKIETQNVKLRQAISHRLSNVLDQLSQDKVEKTILSQAMMHTAYKSMPSKCDPWECENRELGERVAKLCKEVIVPKTTTSNRIMYSEEYQKHFLPQTSLVDFQIKLLASTEFDPKGFKKFESSLSEFELLEGESPSCTLESFIHGPTIADCGSTIEALFFKALKDEIGNLRFDALFSRSDLRLRITHKGPMNHQSLINLFTKYMLGYQAGARCYFEGHPDYTQKHGNGIGLGLHAMIACDPKPLFWGLGHSSFHTELKICEYLLDQYEKAPEENLLLALKKEAWDEKEAGSSKPCEKSAIGLGGLEYVDRLSAEIIHLITKSSVEEIRLKDFKRKLLLLSGVTQAKTLILAE